MIPLDYLNDTIDEPVTIQIRGKVTFSHIARKYEGAELVRNNERRRKYGLSQINIPHSSFAIRDAEYVRDEKMDLDVYGKILKLYEENFEEQKQSKHTAKYSAISFSEWLPKVYVTDATSKIIQMFDINNPLRAELSKDLDVTLGIQLYKNKYGNVAENLQYIIVHEPLRYYSPSYGFER